jgi:prepilin peptidase CpaA
MFSAETVAPTMIFVMLVAFVVLCWAFDLRERRIPNWLSAAAIVVGVVFHLLFLGVPGMMQSLLGLLLAGGALLVPFLLGGIGAGDVKMMGAVGSLLGPWLGLQAVIAGFIAGGVFALVHLAFLGRAGEKLRATFAMLADSARRRTIEPLRANLDDPAAIALPYSLPLGIGSLAVAFFARGMVCL